MFRGLYEHTIDAKGRVSLPAKFREAIVSRGSDRLVVTMDVEQCLLAYALPEWQAFEARLGALPQMDRRVRMIKRALIAGAHELQVDGNGRILIPPALRDYAALGRDVVFAGQIEHIAIWNKDSWGGVRGGIDADALQQAMEDLGI